MLETQKSANIGKESEEEEEEDDSKGSVRHVLNEADLGGEAGHTQAPRTTLSSFFLSKCRLYFKRWSQVKERQKTRPEAEIQPVLRGFCPDLGPEAPVCVCVCLAVFSFIPNASVIHKPVVSWTLLHYPMCWRHTHYFMRNVTDSPFLSRRHALVFSLFEALPSADSLCHLK